jgi:2-oxo-3-hexenedioate decarboxylase
VEKVKREELAELLTQARLEKRPIEQLSKEIQNFQVVDAYKIQDMGIEHRFERGEIFKGLKMGLTSKAKREQMNLDSPLYGVLTDKMAIANGDHFSMEKMIHPKIEPEIAFVLKKDITKKITLEEAGEACGSVLAALEILDSRYTQFKYFSLEDVIADNASSSHYILGQERTDFSSIDLLNLKMDLYIDGKLEKEGLSKDISGHPLLSVVELANIMVDRGLTVKSGSIILAGASTAAVMLRPGMDCRLVVQDLGEVQIKIKDEEKEG